MITKNNFSIIHLSQVFLPGGGGLENSINCIIQASVKEGYCNQELICISNESIRNEEKAFDSSYPIKIFRIKSRFFSFYKKLFKNFNSIVGGRNPLTSNGKISMLIVGFISFFSLFTLLMQRLFKKKQVMLHCYSLSGAAVAFVAKKIFIRKKIKIIMGVHFVYTKARFAPVDLVLMNCLKGVDYFVCVSSAVKKSIETAYDIDPSKVAVSYNWLTIDDLSKIKISKRDDYGKTPIELLFVGRIIPEKGIREIINLGNYILKNKLTKEFHITVIGDSVHPIKKTLEHICSINPAMSYLGRINIPQLWEFYQRSHVFLMISTSEEAFGRTIIESYAAGLPVIGSNFGGIPEVLNYFPCHRVINRYEASDIIDAIRSVVSEVQKYGYSNLVEDSSRVIKKHFSEENFSGYSSIYQKLAKEFDE